MINSNYAIIIQARTSSKRFPNKILKKVNKHEVLAIMLKRLKKKFKKKIIIAIGKKNCSKIINVCKKEIYKVKTS